MADFVTDTAVRRDQFAPEVEWMLADGVAPVAGEGIVCAFSRIWSEDGRLLASDRSSHIFCPNPGHADEVARARAMGVLPPEE